MLEIKISRKEGFNNKTSEFIECKETTLCLEHSLVSLSKWEAKYNKPFITDDPKTKEETLDYIRFMTITQNVDPNVYSMMSKDELDKINKYIEASMTATKFYENKTNGNTKPASRKKEVVTSELIYYWMISFQIPFECQKWHLNRLLTLIRICSIKERQANGKGGKMSRKDILSQNSALNAARRQRMKSHG